MSLKVKRSTLLANLRSVSPVEVGSPLDLTAFPPSQQRASSVPPIRNAH